MAHQPKLTIAVDIDEVLGHFVPQLCAFHNEKYGSSFKLADFHSYNFWECGLGANRDDTTRICFEFFASDHFLNMPPISGAAAALNHLKSAAVPGRQVDLVVVTSRQLDIEEATKVWLQRHYPDVFSAVRFGHHYGKADDNRKPKTKAELCAELGATVLIDDSLIYANQCSASIDHVVLFDHDGSYPWNKTQNALPANVHRVHSWPEVIDTLVRLHQ